MLICFLLPYFACSQIWLNCINDDGQPVHYYKTGKATLVWALKYVQDTKSDPQEVQ
jgi:hypothetical protein